MTSAQSMLRAIVTDARGGLRRGAALLADGPDESVLLLPVSGECLVIRECPEGDVAALDALAARLAQLRRSVTSGHVSVLVTGGGTAVRQALRRAGSSWPGRLTLFQIDFDGELFCDRWTGPGARTVRPVLRHALAQLRRAAAEGAPLAPLTAEEKASLAAVRRVASGDAAFWSALAARTPWATYALVGACAAVFALEVLWSGGLDLSMATVLDMGANESARVRAGEVFRLLSYAFLHGGLLHLIFNLRVLWVLGPFLERVFGSGRFLLLYLAAALGGGVAGVLLSPGVPIVGASGALWGLMAGEFALAYRGGALLPDGVRDQVRRRGWEPLLLNLVISLLPGISLATHAGGGLAGGLLVASGLLTRGLSRPGSGEPPRGVAERTMIVASGIVLAAAVAAALVVGRPWSTR